MLSRISAPESTAGRGEVSCAASAAEPPNESRNHGSTSSGNARHVGEVAGQPCVDPGARDGAVQVARELRVADGMPGDVAPDVRPDVVFAALADQVPDDLVAVQRDDTGQLVALLFELGTEVDVGREQGLDRAMSGVPLREQGGGAVQMLVGKRDDLGPGHGT